MEKSFVYDIADLYKSYITVEPSFKAYKKYRGYDKDMVLSFVKEAVEENKIVSKIPSDLKRIICS